MLPGSEWDREVLTPVVFREGTRKRSLSCQNCHQNCHVAFWHNAWCQQDLHNPHKLVSSSRKMRKTTTIIMYRSSIIALVALLVATTSDAYMFGPAPRTRYSTRIRPGISHRYTQRQAPPQYYSPMRPAPRKSAAVTAVPASPQKNPFQSMLDFYSTMIWIARPDLFLYDRLARFAWENISKNLKKLEEEKLPENVLNSALREMQVSFS